MRTVREIILSGSTWTPPPGVLRVNVLACLGPGGDGRSSANNGGGPGGAFASKANVTFPQGPVDIQIGAGGSENDTWFKDAATVMAKAGLNAPSSTTGSAGGAAASSIGDVTSSGGEGGNGAGTSGNSRGGGGGGAGGPTGDGLAGGNAVSGGDGGDGGDGDNGAGGLGGAGAGAGETADSGTNQALWTDTSGRVNDGLTVGPGGGGGGAGTSATAGNGGYGAGGGSALNRGDGGDGFIVLEYTLPSQGMMTIFEDSF